VAAVRPFTDRASEVPATTTETSPPRGRTALALAAAWGGVLTLLVLSVAAAQLSGRPLSDFTRDPVAVVEAPFYVGFLSNVGVLLWTGVAAACLVAGEVLRRVREPQARLLLAAGALSAVLALDDLFRGHEVLNERLGVPQPLLPALYAAAIALLCARNLQLLRRTEWKLLAAALALFGTSAAIDGLLDPGRTTALEALEDVVKLFGIATWAAYFVPLAVLSLVQAASLRGPREPTAAETPQ
jgi:hypothetical protein